MAIIGAFFLFSSVFAALPATAQSGSGGWLNRANEGGLNTIGTQAYGQNASAPTPLAVIIANIIKVILGVLGVIFVILIIIAGFKYMTAAGNDEKVKEAVAQIRNAVIGLLIILASYAITTFVTSQIIRATSNNSPF